MDTGIIQSIQTRREALYRHYDLPGEARRKAEALFSRMEQFGQECRSRAEFENKFETLTMNHEYNDLFVEFTAYIKENSAPIPLPQEMQEAQEMHHISQATAPAGRARGGSVSLLQRLKALKRLFRRRRKKKSGSIII